MEFNAKKFPVLEMGNSEMRPKWPYTLVQNIISIEKEEKNLGAII